jgi:hypothetical protein
MLSTRVVLLQFMLLVCLAVILIPAGTHLFEYSAKMALEPSDYMVTQRIYAGWAWFGVPIYACIALLVLHAFVVRGLKLSFALTIASLVLIIVTQLIFWRYTFPMNALTSNWTSMPPDLEAARRQWELSHAVNAVLTFLAFITGSLAVLTSRPR